MKSKSIAPGGWREDILPLCTVLVLTALYLFTFFNRFAGLRSGDGEFGGGIAFLSGLRPYRDYFTAGPPLNQLKSALELALFGKLLIVSRIMAVLERLLIATTLYYWLRRLFSVQASMLATLVTIIVCTGDRTDPLASYNHDAIFLAMLCGLAASFATDAESGRKLVLWSVAAGVSGALSFLTKQTVGAAATLTIFLFGSIALLRTVSIRDRLVWSATYWIGFSIPVALTAIYLWYLHAFRACLDMLFVSGPKAKASTPFVFISREVTVAVHHWIWLVLAVMALVLSASAVFRAIFRSRQEERLSRRQWLQISVCAAITFGVAEVLAFTSVPALDDFGKSSVYYSFVGTTVLGFVALYIATGSNGEQRRRALHIALMAALSWACAAALSLSWPAFEPMALPGLGLLLAAAIDGTRHWGKYFLYLVMVAMIFIQVREKLEVPFSFDHQDEPPVRFESARSTQGALRGMRLAPKTVRFIDDAVTAIRTRTNPTDTIFTYPEMGLFYSLTGRNAPTRTSSHNMDVVQDSFAREEAKRLLQAPPAVIVFAKPSEEELRSDEQLWREGHQSGQRSIISAVEKIVTDYQLVGTYRLAPQDDVIRLYVRPSPGN